MKIERVRQLSPGKRYLYWIRERESIRLSREAGQEPPFTDDEILQKFRFCNVRRMDDAVSRWLLSHWYEPFRDHPSMLCAAALARFLNLPSSLGAITRPVFEGPKGHPDWPVIKKILRRLKEQGPIFNAAYMVRGNDGKDKVSCVIDYNVRPLHDDPPLINTSSIRESWEALVARHGFGSFMAGQVIADLRWALTGEWADRHEWAAVGPGSSRGMCRLLGKPPESNMSQERFLPLLLDLIKHSTKKLPASITERLEAIDWQNTLCEFNGYSRTLLGEGRKKEMFQGPGVKYGVDNSAGL